jgi:hypothetical protein
MMTGSDSPSVETSIALLPSFKLPFEKGAPRRVIRERGQMAI